jgi:hypothetical protein
MNYVSLDYEKFGMYKSVPAVRDNSNKGGLPVISFQSTSGKMYRFPYRTRKQRSEISEVLKNLKNESSNLNKTLESFSKKIGKCITESGLRTELKTVFGYSKGAIDSILASK